MAIPTTYLLYSLIIHRWCIETLLMGPWPLVIWDLKSVCLPFFFFTVPTATTNMNASLPYVVDVLHLILLKSLLLLLLMMVDEHNSRQRLADYSFVLLLILWNLLITRGMKHSGNNLLIHPTPVLISCKLFPLSAITCASFFFFFFIFCCLLTDVVDTMSADNLMTGMALDVVGMQFQNGCHWDWIWFDKWADKWGYEMSWRKRSIFFIIPNVTRIVFGWKGNDNDGLCFWFVFEDANRGGTREGLGGRAPNAKFRGRKF